MKRRAFAEKRIGAIAAAAAAAAAAVVVATSIAGGFNRLTDHGVYDSKMLLRITAYIIPMSGIVFWPIGDIESD
ncbi:hypothetical protein I9W82_004409 [Candida metapsilosis]|uniref:Uncharacterized protein n=1 Tax=Candida metapsilosis TaxID=273372 RepID=A0A8H7ZEQ3_9ASCO|nr:hypothetical protein I9W82_004409 [Candida metapsilosis]